LHSLLAQDAWVKEAPMAVPGVPQWFRAITTCQCFANAGGVMDSSSNEWQNCPEAGRIQAPTLEDGIKPIRGVSFPAGTSCRSRA